MLTALLIPFALLGTVWFVKLVRTQPYSDIDPSLLLETLRRQGYEGKFFAKYRHGQGATHRYDAARNVFVPIEPREAVSSHNQAQ